MSRKLPLSGKVHPLTGKPIQALGFRRNGCPIWPIIGAADPVRPDDVPEAEWDALGDPGKQALVRERGKVADLERQLAAARARPTPPPAAPAPAPTPAPAPVATEQPKATSNGETPDFAALIKDAVDAAIKPFQERDQQRAASEAADRIKSAVVTAAKDRLHDGTDGLMIDLTTVVAEDGTPDAEKIGKALDALVASKPHLAKDTRRFAAPGVGPTVGGAAVPMQQQVQSVLAQMQTATGVRVSRSE